MNVCFYVDHLNVPLSNEPLKTNNDAGSEINFFREAPTGDWNFFQLPDEKMWLPKGNSETPKCVLFQDVFQEPNSIGYKDIKILCSLQVSLNGDFVK